MANELLSDFLGDPMLNALIEGFEAGVYCTDLQRRIVYWSSAAEEITGYKREAVLGKHCYANILRHIDENGNSLCMGSCPLACTLKDGEFRKATVYFHHRDGHRVPSTVKIWPIQDPRGNVVGALEVFTDDSESISVLEKLQQLEQQVWVDALTGLPNRRYVDRVLQTYMGDWERLALPFGILFIDIDNFKGFNDSHGHAVGDLVLRTVAQTLCSSLRSHDVVGRWGGEEFVGIVSAKDELSLMAVAERCRTLVEASAVDVDGESLGVTISVGAALCREGDHLAGLVARADFSLLKAKAQGRNRSVLSEPGARDRRSDVA